MAAFQSMLRITNQPQKNIRFRYSSETGTHGVLNSRNSTQDFPSIELEVPLQYNKSEFIVVTNLYKPTRSKATNPELAAELLAEKSKKTHSYGPVVEPMTKINENVYTFSLKNFYIIRQKKENILSTLKAKYEEMEKFVSGKSELSQRQKDEIEGKFENHEEEQLKQVCLGFSIYTKDQNGQYCLFCPPLLSEPIYNSMNIQIVKLCNITATSEDVVTLLVSEAKKNEVEVFLFEIDKCDYDENMTPRVLWNHTIRGDNLKIHKQAAIYFRMPTYTGAAQRPEVTLYLVVKRPKHGDESDSVKIFYKREATDDESSAKRRKLPTRIHSVLDNLTAQCLFIDSAGSEMRSKPRIPELASETKQVKAEIELLEKRLSENPENWHNILYEKNEDGESKFKLLCLEAIESDLFMDLTKIAKKYSLQTFVEGMRISRQESLLHYACRLNKSKVIRELIGMGCEVDALDCHKQTPLYLAIKHKNQDCIDVFSDIIGDTKADNGLNIEQKLKHMLTIYDAHGFTVLHKAVLDNQLELVQSILHFCKMHRINTDHYEVLGEGDKILHLAASKGLKEMAKIIYRNNPDSIFSRNYAGYSVSDDDEVMQQLQLIAIC